MGKENPQGSPQGPDKPSGRVDVMATFPTHSRTVTYKVKTDQQQPKQHVSEFSVVDDSTWLLSVSDLRKIWFQSADGEIRVLRDVDYTENVSVEYDPPLRFLSPKLQPDQPLVGESKMIVRDLRTKAIRDQGTCAYRVEWVATKKAETKLGELDVIHIRMTRNIKLSLATVDITIDQLRHAKFGLVRGYTVRNTKALGLIGGTTAEDMRLVQSSAVEATNKTAGDLKAGGGE